MGCSHLSWVIAVAVVTPGEDADRTNMGFRESARELLGVEIDADIRYKAAGVKV
jgi:hypothetical protein